MTEKHTQEARIMKLKDADCRNCYKCLRFCPVNAISLTEDQASIKEDLCIYCGKCYMVCPQDARDTAGNLDMVKAMIKAGEKIYVSLASGFSSYFNTTSLKAMGAALKALGFYRVEETAVGGNLVVSEYEKVIKSGDYKNIISTLCPSTNFMIQKYYPDLVQWMCPVDTPLEAHAKMMRAAYGQDIKVVGIGACLADCCLADMTDDGKLINAYITYEELELWLKEKGIEIGPEDPDTLPASNYRGRYLEEEGGLFRALPGDVKYNYRIWEINGASRTGDMLRGMDSEDTHNFFMAVSACANNCLGGPVVRLACRDTFESKERWLTSIKEGNDNAGENPSEKAVVDIRKTFVPLPVEKKIPGEAELQYFLSLIGRTRPEERLDCGGCGYNTCLEKAVAVCQGMADPFMCIPNSRAKAEAKSNLLFDNSPSGVIVMDRDFMILEINPEACEILGMSEALAAGRCMKDFIDEEFLEKSYLKEVGAVHERLESKPLRKLLDLTFFKIPDHGISMLVMDDRTLLAERHREEMEKRQETLEVTGKVVEKQMRIAQEIASLLGETTAETKLALNRLKNILSDSQEEGSWK